MHDEWNSHVAGVFDRAAATFDTFDVDFFRLSGQRLVIEAGVHAGDRVLDVGCGGGASLVPAAMAVGASGSAIGIDLSPRMVDRANDRLKLLELRNARAILGDGSNPDHALGSFDVILAGFVVFFFADVDQAIRRYHQILTPGGRLAISLKPEDTPELAEVTDLVGRVLDRCAESEDSTTYAIRPGPPARSSSNADHRLLADAGFANVRFTESVYRARFSSVADYWNWLWSHGMRERLERIPPGRRDEALSLLQVELEPCLDDHRGLSFTMPARYAVGERL